MMSRCLIERSLRAESSPSPLKGERAGVRGEAVRLISVDQREQTTNGHIKKRLVLRLAPICNPKGIVPSSPGLRATSYPGYVPATIHNPNGVAAVSAFP